MRSQDQQRVDEDNLLSSSVDLTARLVSMMDIGALQYAFSGRKSMAWNRGSLKDLVNDYFSDSFKLGHDVKLEEIFNARNLDRIASQVLKSNGRITSLITYV